MTEIKILSGIPPRYFIAKLVFQIVIDTAADFQFDVQYRFLAAASAELAIEKAKKIAELEEGTFLNEKKENVSWKFIDVSALHALDLSDDGMQLYSETYETANPFSYIHSVKQRAKNLVTGENKQGQKNTHS